MQRLLLRVHLATATGFGAESSVPGLKSTTNTSLH